ncbi:Gfo/Idh/MocA family protein [Salimicrobium halophilum]|uniref:Predicted dehydrogenase n=1 Tax=Salimicrobium halophilum TaxID=86666 RepID=A0A1G8SAJ0_9BACI|nr:Gfo/Idh/MocA family oxidoreductase [Salimicrobium halophilum]SDJ26214.1 Predicted dehydrogenase [Salimicrobium halophilum]
MSTIKIGIIGAGRFGRLHLNVLSELPGCEVVAVADISEEALQNVEKEFDVKKTYVDANEMINDEEVDAVDIVSDESTHGAYAINALKSNKHVFIEKPIATSVQEAKQIDELAKEKGKHVLVGNISRFSSPYYSIYRAVREGRLGKVAMIRAKRNFSKSWFAHFGKRVHPVYESGIHDIDLALWYAGSPCVEVYASERNISGFKHPDLFSAVLTFENGVIASIDSSWLYPEGGPRNLVETLELDGTIDADIEVIGEKGTATYALNHPGYSINTETRTERPALTLWSTEIDGIGGAIRSELNYFLRLIERKEENEIAPVSDSVEGLKIADAIVQSAEEGRPVKF